MTRLSINGLEHVRKADAEVRRLAAEFLANLKPEDILPSWAGLEEAMATTTRTRDPILQHSHVARWDPEMEFAFSSLTWDRKPRLVFTLDRHDFRDPKYSRGGLARLAEQFDRTMGAMDKAFGRG